MLANAAGNTAGHLGETAGALVRAWGILPRTVNDACGVWVLRAKGEIVNVLFRWGFGQFDRVCITSVLRRYRVGIFVGEAGSCR